MVTERDCYFEDEWRVKVRMIEEQSGIVKRVVLS